MPKANEKNLQFGQAGLAIETEQDPDSSNPKALTNAPEGSLKHAVNVDYRGGKNLKRRKGYEDLWHDPEAKTVEITLNGVTPMTNEPTVGDILQDSTTTAQMRVLSADLATFTIIGISLDANLFVVGNGVVTAATSMAAATLAPVPPPDLDISAVDYAISQYDVHCQFEAAPSGEFCDSVQTWDDTKTATHGIRGLWRYTYLDNRENKSDAGYDLERYTIFAHRDESDFPDATPTATAPVAETHTYHFRNRATPNIHRLELPILDRNTGYYDTQDANGDYVFSDVNVWAYRKARFWNYLTWARGGEQETYLIGVEGGHYVTPVSPAVPAAAGIDAVPPVAWNCGAAGTQPPAGSFDQTRAAAGTQNYECINDQAIQRRALIWFPTWYEWWASVTGYTSVPEVGLHNWWAPFIFYFDVGQGGASDFYAEPCGRFIERYKDSLFMARIERTELVNNGDTVDDTLEWKYEPSGIMWSFWGYATGMELGTPPVYPFAIPFEPDERVWGCAADGYQLNRHASFSAGDGLAIVGLREWNDRLYVMKPNGFMEISGTYSGNFLFRDLGMSQGPAGPFAWAKTDMGIFYVTKKGLYLFDGNPASQNICLSDGSRGGADVSKIFENDIDWNTATNFLTGEVLSVSMVWDKANAQIIISYPKVGEQGQGGANDLPRGTPTRMLVYDTTAGRFTEWDYPMVVDSDTSDLPCPGMMLAGRDPTDDDTIIVTHPIGNFIPTNDNGRLIYIASEGHRDNVEIDGSGDPIATSGDRITYNATSADMPLGGLRPKASITRQRSVVYTNNGSVLRRVTYNYHDTNAETALVFGTDEEGYYSNEEIVHQSVHTGDVDSLFSIVSFTYYHDDSAHTAITLTFNTGGNVMTAVPTVGDTLTQLVTGATMLVTSVNLGALQVTGVDTSATGVAWNLVNGASDGGGGTLAPDPCIPSVFLGGFINPDNTNPDLEPIEFVMTSVDIMPTSGDAGS